MNRILVSDYDQTFYLNDEDIKKNIIAVNKFKEKGNLFIIATGRSYDSIKIEIDNYGINYDYLIINHGATILDRDCNILFSFYIEDNIKDKIVGDLYLERTILNMYSYDLETYRESNHKNLTRIHVQYKNKKDADNVFNIIQNKYSKYINVYRLNDERAFEIITNKTNKSKAIDLLLDKLNISKENVYTIGDGYSDIKMIKDFKGNAMKKSLSQLKEAANKEYESVSELIYDIM